MSVEHFISPIRGLTRSHRHFALYASSRMHARAHTHLCIRHPYTTQTSRSMSSFVATLTARRSSVFSSGGAHDTPVATYQSKRYRPDSSLACPQPSSQRWRTSGANMRDDAGHSRGAARRPRVLVIAGATGVGKSDIALRIATSGLLQDGPGEIVSADSAQVCFSL